MDGGIPILTHLLLDHASTKGGTFSQDQVGVFDRQEGILSSVFGINDLLYAFPELEAELASGWVGTVYLG